VVVEQRTLFHFLKHTQITLDVVEGVVLVLMDFQHLNLVNHRQHLLQ
jgi:hypothetical protein